MKTVYNLLLPLTLFAALVSSQQACDDAQDALAANEECTAASLQVNLYLNGFNVVVTREELNMYCSETCRNLYLQIITDCIDDADQVSIRLDNRRSFAPSIIYEQTDLLCSC